MGKVAKPLTIVVFPPLDEWPEFEKLGKQGHNIVKATAGGFAKYFETTSLTEGESKLSALFKEADIIMGPKCWYLTELHRKHLLSSVKQARLRRYGTIAKKRKKGDDNEETIPDTDPESSGC